jgi:hypothetical protein
VNTLLRMFTRLAMGRSYVFRPMAKLFYTKKIVNCPEADQPAEILIETIPSAPSKPNRKLFSIRNCSLWPKRKGCMQGCEK